MFWDVAQRSYRRFDTTYRSHLQGSRSAIKKLTAFHSTHLGKLLLIILATLYFNTTPNV